MTDVQEIRRHAVIAATAAKEAEIAARQAMEAAQEAWHKAAKANREAELVVAMLDFDGQEGGSGATPSGPAPSDRLPEPTPDAIGDESPRRGA